jgi:phospholipase A1
MHKSNYFITGVPTNQEINSTTANLKYQISFKQSVTRNKLPWDTHLYLTYTQKSFWNVYDESLPFEDINFNPSVTVEKPLYNKEDLLTGFASLAIEHESNGRDSLASRSWNRLTASYTTKIAKNTTANFKAWLPFIYKTGNPDILEYVGLTEFNMEHEFIDKKLYFNLMMRKGLNLEFKGAVRSRLLYNPFKTNRSNQYLMLEWFVGQAEGLLNYQRSDSYIRVGYVLKTTEFNFLR